MNERQVKEMLESAGLTRYTITEHKNGSVKCYLRFCTSFSIEGPIKVYCIDSLKDLRNLVDHYIRRIEDEIHIQD